MLVLTRNEGEAFEFPELGIRVVFLSRKGHAVRFGIEAPREVLILREEVRREDEKGGDTCQK